jgi:hypothetical protein
MRLQSHSHQEQRGALSILPNRARAIPAWKADRFRDEAIMSNLPV